MCFYDILYIKFLSRVCLKIVFLLSFAGLPDSRYAKTVFDGQGRHALVAAEEFWCATWGEVCF